MRFEILCSSNWKIVNVFILILLSIFTIFFMVGVYDPHIILTENGITRNVFNMNGISGVRSYAFVGCILSILFDANMFLRLIRHRAVSYTHLTCTPL